MKPDSWDDMSDDERAAYAKELAKDARGWFLIGQALHYALKALRAVPKPYQETSNIEDMEMLREEVFNIPIIEPPATFPKE